MELRDYLAVLRRRWFILAGVVAIVLAAGAAFAIRGPRSFEAVVRLAVSVGAPPGSEAADPPPYVYYRDYYLWLASEYLADDLSEVIQSDAFAADVAAMLREPVDSSSIRDVLRVRKTHRILEVTVQAQSPESTRRIAEAIVGVIREKGHNYLAQLATRGGQVVSIDEPRVKPATTTGSLALDLGLRGILALIVGVFVAFVVDYLDSTVRSTREVERGLGLQVLGEIPAAGR